MLKKLSSLLPMSLLMSFCFITLVACDSKTTEKTSDSTASKNTSMAADSISIIEPMVRAMPPGQKTTAMYMKLKNSSSSMHNLVKVESNISDMIELHTHTNDNGVMKMGQVESLPIGANSTAEAKPGSYHVMIMNLKKDLVSGETFNFTLSFKDGSTLAVTAEVKQVPMHQH